MLLKNAATKPKMVIENVAKMQNMVIKSVDIYTKTL